MESLIKLVTEMLKKLNEHIFCHCVTTVIMNATRE